MMAKAPPESSFLDDSAPAEQHGAPRLAHAASRQAEQHSPPRPHQASPGTLQHQGGRTGATAPASPCPGAS